MYLLPWHYYRMSNAAVALWLLTIETWGMRQVARSQFLLSQPCAAVQVLGDNWQGRKSPGWCAIPNFSSLPKSPPDIWAAWKAKDSAAVKSSLRLPKHFQLVHLPWRLLSLFYAQNHQAEGQEKSVLQLLLQLNLQTRTQRMTHAAVHLRPPHCGLYSLKPSKALIAVSH